MCNPRPTSRPTVALAFLVAVAAVAMPTSKGEAANPCSPNPCGAAANPCATNPCAANPCAANPCAAKNPCAPAPAAQLSGKEAAARYAAIADALQAGYAKSDRPVAAAYRRWKRYNTVPYVSETHGGRFVNNYANDAAKAYGRFEEAGTLPAGAVVAKDSFRVTPKGKTEPGPLFIMEKMKPGFSPETGDWRYTMILPNGAVYGATKGRNAAQVKFCADCHGGLAKEQDSLFFLPEEVRVRP